MFSLLFGIIIFFVIHLLPSFVSFKKRIISRVGATRYTGLYSITALLGLAFIIYGKSEAAFYAIWEPLSWSKNLVIAVMPISFFFLVAADMKSNVKRYLPHPMLIGILIWAIAHLFANGDLASIILFGSFCFFSLLLIFSANRRGATKQTTKYPLSKDLTTLMISLIAYVVFIKLVHPYIIGVVVV